jgi:hypothetical protein
MSTQSNFPLQDQATNQTKQKKISRQYIVRTIYKAINIFGIQNIILKVRIFISLFQKNTPDAGHWSYNIKNNKWVENLQLAKKTKSHYTLRRENGNSKYIFHIDSFPRQGNTSLRAIFLEVFPTLIMPDAMVHVVAFTEEKIKKGEIVVSTLREPHDTLCSFISRSISDNEINKDLFESKNKINKQIIKSAVKYYNRYIEFNIKNYDKIYFISFEQVLSMYQDYLSKNETNNYILKYFSKKYNLPFATIEKTHPRVDNINYRSTVNQDVKAYLITNKFYLKKIKKSYKLYNKLANMIDTDQRGIYNNGI